MKTGTCNDQPGKRPYRLTLTASRGEEALRYTDDLSTMVDKLLVEFIDRKRNERRLRQETNDEVCASLNRFHDQHGSFVPRELGR
ncbi:type II toxin-antitoxin system CcdA family antitoxin [Aromatoleum toluolicum]|uniref:Uncharacterized protein n=1 Tax=Aromatoleum toluolicum TaxID=90060 RepID=A0ABX1NA91_9RHOO|nr:type II toxin-antitoxin system CcdA family antitoxin [Aromatoleum toluolicum]NMF96154.1 type II toxin-antitoxin system CcdA family antitoxin [Aromatoleum toluolicum]